MPRLIDLDELEKDTEWDEYFDGFTSYSSVMIDEAEIVEAIPVEWIKRYIAEEGIYPNRELLSVEQADAIERMIENWERENAGD